MVEENQKRFDELLAEMVTLFSGNVVSFKLVVTADHARLTQNYRYAERLKKAGISMRNIKGDFIK